MGGCGYSLLLHNAIFLSWFVVFVLMSRSRCLVSQLAGAKVSAASGDEGMAASSATREALAEANGACRSEGSSSGIRGAALLNQAAASSVRPALPAITAA